ncbi:hypothetical protein [Niabella beijingensis]|uniref:hypothetical protein n=1 Tax=Niabella beijingensis TaxID=2872700 RepID=UPI001CBB4F1E|nr:hypothetical protein [Niabella beijingensis]MBZ4187600.1 hypothetical protein [Niabella beijingensis]
MLHFIKIRRLIDTSFIFFNYVLYEKLLGLWVVVGFLLSGCSKGKAVDQCQSAILYYTPDCASIKGYITLEGNNTTYLFQHDIDKKFQSSSLKVCVEYKIIDDKILKADCAQGSLIELTNLQLQ